MPRTWTFVDASAVKPLNGITMSKEMEKQISYYVRDTLAMIQSQHKKKEIRRGGGKPIAGRWTTRQGDTERSFHIDWRTGALVGAYGSGAKHARMLEHGGIIKPVRSRFLAIPTENVKRDMPPRSIPGLVFVQSLRGQPLLVLPYGGDNAGFVTMFILKRQVRMPARPTLAHAINNTKRKREARMSKMIDMALGRVK